jgi:hypothetical protein
VLHGPSVLAERGSGRPVGVMPTGTEGHTVLSMNTAWGENPALSYRNLRAITGYVGLTLPVVLLLDGLADGHIESSLSAYYTRKSAMSSPGRCGSSGSS